MNREEVLAEFMKDRNCAQCVLGAFAEAADYKLVALMIR